MTILVHTARLSPALRGRSDVLDITRKSGCALGRLFAPSWKILGPGLEARKRAAALRERSVDLDALSDEAVRIEREAWEAYVPAYTAEMRESYRCHRARWNELLARESVTLVCYCPGKPPALRCHRVLLAEILVKLGATYAGEAGHSMS
ncbi:MAG: hypothetical protein HOW73_44955 [Polyangiaceae bacterium]|nr:hypothetical protein [Polyangiaceae bacterium]